MARYRPTAVLVLAILHFVGGGIGLITTLLTAGVQVMNSNRAAAAAPAPSAVTAQDLGAALTRYIEDHVPSYQALTYGQLAVSLVLDLLLLVGGVGLLNMRPWGRSLSLGYAGLSILNRLFGIVYGFAVVLPVTREYLQLVARQNPRLAGAVTGGEIGGIIGMVASFVFILYPIAVFIILLHPRVAAAFRGAGLPPEPAEPPDFLDDDRPFRPGEPPPSDAITR
jgi:hypothetical protein